MLDANLSAFLLPACALPRGNRCAARPSLSKMGTTEATLRMENVDVKEEWQDEDFPRFVPCKKSQGKLYFFL